MGKKKITFVPFNSENEKVIGKKKLEEQKTIKTPSHVNRRHASSLEQKSGKSQSNRGDSSTSSITEEHTNTDISNKDPNIVDIQSSLPKDFCSSKLVEIDKCGDKSSANEPAIVENDNQIDSVRILEVKTVDNLVPDLQKFNLNAGKHLKGDSVNNEKLSDLIKDSPSSHSRSPEPATKDGKVTKPPDNPNWISNSPPAARPPFSGQLNPDAHEFCPGNHHDDQLKLSQECKLESSIQKTDNQSSSNATFSHASQGNVLQAANMCPVIEHLQESVANIPFYEGFVGNQCAVDKELPQSPEVCSRQVNDSFDHRQMERQDIDLKENQVGVVNEAPTDKAEMLIRDDIQSIETENVSNFTPQVPATEAEELVNPDLRNSTDAWSKEEFLEREYPTQHERRGGRNGGNYQRNQRSNFHKNDSRRDPWSNQERSDWKETGRSHYNDKEHNRRDNRDRLEKRQNYRYQENEGNSGNTRNSEEFQERTDGRSRRDYSNERFHGKSTGSQGYRGRGTGGRYNQDRGLDKTDVHQNNDRRNQNYRGQGSRGHRGANWGGRSKPNYGGVRNDQSHHADGKPQHYRDDSEYSSKHVDPSHEVRRDHENLPDEVAKDNENRSKSGENWRESNAEHQKAPYNRNVNNRQYGGTARARQDDNRTHFERGGKGYERGSGGGRGKYNTRATDNHYQNRSNRDNFHDKNRRYFNENSELKSKDSSKEKNLDTSQGTDEWGSDLNNSGNEPGWGDEGCGADQSTFSTNSAWDDNQNPSGTNVVLDVAPKTSEADEDWDGDWNTSVDVPILEQNTSNTTQESNISEKRGVNNTTVEKHGATDDAWDDLPTRQQYKSNMATSSSSYKGNEGTRRSFGSFDTKKAKDPRMERLNKSTGSAGSSATIQDTDKENWDKEFDRWEMTWEKVTNFQVVKEIQGNLFEQPKDFSLAHCVAEDLRMGSGIAVDFKREFKNLPDLLDQRVKQGGLATLTDDKNKRYVYYLVTKRESSGKPTYLTLWKSLNRMKDHVKENEVKKLAVPRLACGLDRLEWKKVKSMIEYLFKDIDVEIVVCNFQQDEESPIKSLTCKLFVEEYPVTKIAAGTLILYFSTENGDVDENMERLSKKFKYLTSFKTHRPKTSGNIIYTEQGDYGLCGCIVRKTAQDEISFKSLSKCVQEFNKTNKKLGNDAFEYVAFQWVNETDYFDDLINHKIITILINHLRNVYVYVCRGISGDNEE